MSEHDREKLLNYTTQIVTALVGHNTIPAEQLPGLVQAVYHSLATAGQGGSTSVLDKQRPEPAVSPRRSVFQDYIICLEDGKKLKMLRRHLKTVYKLTPEQYRERWNLPPDYPMTAPSYAKQRSKLAKQIGLGTKSRKSIRDKAA